jgi:hypothetical protein
MGTLINIMSIKKPYLENFKKVSSFIFTIFFRIWDPSNGGMGRRLKRKSTALREII